MAVTTKKLFAATCNATTTAFTPVSIQLNNQDDLDVYVTLSGGTRVLQLRQSTGSTAQSSHPQVNNTDGLYYPAVSAGTTLYNYQLSTDNNTITFNSALPQGAVVFCERRTRDADGTYTSFASGSTIRATDLNNSAQESNFTAQEARNKAFDLEGKIYNTIGQADLVVKTTDTGTVDSTMIANGTIVNADINASADIQGSKLLDDSVTLDKLGSGTLPTDITVASANIVDGTIVNADINASADIAGTKLADDSVTLAKLGSGALPTDITVASANLVDGTIVNADINSSANIDGDKLANDSVSLGKLEGGALPTDITVASTNIVDGTIVNADINASAAIAGTKVTPAFNDQNISTTGTLASGAHTVTGNITISGTVDGRDLAADGTKLDGIETAATADQTAAEIRTLTEAATDSNVFTDADHTKLNGIETAATADQTNAEIKTAYEANADTNEFSDAEQSKLAGIETAATADQTASEIKTLLQSDKLTLSEMNTTSLDTRYFTETELTGGALDGRYYTETEAEANFLRQDSSETIASGVTWSNSDAFVATTAAINARIVDLIDDVGGFTAITSEQHFPNTNPQGSTGQAAILSIQAASTTLTPSGTTVTISNGNLANNANIIITGVSAAIPTGFGFLVESTSTLHTYSFHRLVPKATEVTTVASNITNIVNAGANVADINNFADIYQISGSAPTQRADGTSLQDGDLWFNNSNDDLRVWNGSAWAIITPSQAVLDDVAIVSGAITYSEDLGLISSSVTTGSSNGSLDIVADALEDEITIMVSVVNSGGNKYVFDGDTSNPAKAISLHKGWTYTFDLSNSSNANHPLVFQSGGSAYTTNVTSTGTAGQAGAKVVIKIPETQPNTFKYYCSVHGTGMGNTITVVEDPVKAVADIAANVVTVAGISSNVTTVANNNSNVTAVANNETNINAVQANASNINSAVSNASNINSAVSNSTNINTVSGSIADVNRYANEYKISSSAPGSPSAGDLWFDSSTNTLKNYNGSAWLGITSNSGIQNVADDTSPELAAGLDCNDNNLTEVGTVSGNNLQIDFGTL
tara:strand:- start:170 stop:3328 length:3159 start_codon:yes stop_codon:yes gene_type:complete